MVEPVPGFRALAFPGRRAMVLDTMDAWARPHAIHSLIEVDVSDLLRTRAREAEAGGEPLSMTAVVISCAARAVAEQPTVQGIRSGRKLVIFEDVDVATVIERETSGGRVPFAHIVRHAQRKTVRQIQEEIRGVQSLREGELMTRRSAAFRRFDRAPRWLRRAVYALLGRNALWRKQRVGTIGVSAVGMLGRGGGWGIPVPIFPVFVTVGGISERPGVVDGALAMRSHLHLTLSFDHDIVDGGPAARLSARVRELIEGT